MAQKVQAFVTGRFPMFHHEDGVYITQSPIEVSSNPWLEAQEKAGLVGFVAKPKEDKTSEKSAKAQETKSK